jgi:uncharacterized protein (TIGR02265 family)
MPPPPEQLVKGTLLIARLRYLRERGADPLDAALRRLPPEEAHRLRAPILPGSWYPLPLLRRLEAAMAAALGPPSREALFHDIGRTAAASSLAGAHRVYLRPGDPHFLLRHTPSIYAGSFSEGERTYASTGERSAVIHTAKRFEQAHKEECLITTGWLERALELSGATGVTVQETACGLDGAPRCEFRCEWASAEARATAP